VLSVLEQYGPASQATLGRRSGVYLSDLVAALNELAHQGLVKRAPDPADRRRNTITLTPAGQQRLREMDEQMARIQEELLAPLLPSERLEITRLLSKVLHHHASPSIAPSTAPTAW
jgi:DNA-binding MarR family transcriptional regulator